MKDYGKICQKGKSCGSACIYIQKDCLLDFPEGVSRGISKIRDLLEGRVKAGAMSEDEASLLLDRITRGNQKDYDPIGLNEESYKEWEVGWDQARTEELEGAMAALRQKFPDDEEYEAKLNSLIDFSLGAFGYEREKITPTSPEEIEALARNRATLEQLSELTQKVKGTPDMTLEELRAELEPFAAARRTESITDEEVDMFVSLLPYQERNYLRNAGALGTKDTGGVYGDNPESDAVPVRNGPLDLQTKQEADNRMKLFARIFMEEGGKDGYTRLPIHITECDMEHIIPESIGGKRSEQGANYTFLRSSFNQPRSNKPHKEWLDKELSKYEFEKDGITLTPKSRETVRQDRIDKLKAVSEKNEFMRLATQAKRAEDLEEMIKVARAQGDPKLKATMNNKLVALSLGVKGTMTMGLSSNLRGPNLWNWYNSGMPGGAEAGELLAEKRVEIAGDPAKEAQMTKMMRAAPKRMEAYVRRIVPVGEGAINPKTGQMDYVVKGEKRKELTEAIKKARELVIEDILAL